MNQKAGQNSGRGGINYFNPTIVYTAYIHPIPRLGRTTCTKQTGFSEYVLIRESGSSPLRYAGCNVQTGIGDRKQSLVCWV